MITKAELQTVYRAVKAEERRRLGDPPTVEEMLAYAEGTLSPDDESRVGERLVAYPDLIRALTTPFPADDAAPGDPGYLSQEELDRHWASLRTSLGHPSQQIAPESRVLPFWRRASTALAAGLVLAVAGLAWQSRTVEHLNRELAQPHVTSEQWLRPDGTRGASIPTLTMEGDTFLLRGARPAEKLFPKYRIEIVADDDGAPQVLWNTMINPGEEAFALVVPHRFLPPGKYQLVLYGVDGSREERVTSYTVRVAGPGH